MGWRCELDGHFGFFFNDTASTEIYTRSLRDALPIFGVIPEVLRLARELVHPPEADVAPGAGDLLLPNEPGQRPTDLQQAGAAAAVIVGRGHLLLDVRDEDDLLVSNLAPLDPPLDHALFAPARVPGVDVDLDLDAPAPYCSHSPGAGNIEELIEISAPGSCLVHAGDPFACDPNSNGPWYDCVAVQDGNPKKVLKGVAARLAKDGACDGLDAGGVDDFLETITLVVGPPTLPPPRSRPRGSRLWRGCARAFVLCVASRNSTDRAHDRTRTRSVPPIIDRLYWTSQGGT